MQPFIVTPSPPNIYVSRRKLVSLRANFAWTIIGNAGYAGCQWGMLVALAKLGQPEMVGQFALGLAIASPIMLFCSLQLRGVQATDAKREYSFGDYLGLRFITTTVALLVIVGFAVVLGSNLEAVLIITVIGLAKAFESISDIFYGLLQQHEQMDRIAISMLIKGIFSVVIIAAVVYATGSLLWGVIGLAMTWAVILATYDVHCSRKVLDSILSKSGYRFSLSWSKSTLRKLTWLTLPLGIVMFFNSLNANIPRYFIERELGLHDLGIFAALSYLMVAGGTVVNSLAQAATPRLSQYYAAGDYVAFRSLLLNLIYVGALLGIASVCLPIVAGRQMLNFFYNPEYGRHVNVFIWLMIAAALGYVASFLGYGITAARYFRVQTPLFFAVSTAMVISCAVLVPSKHLMGAVLSIVIAMSFQLAMSIGIIIHALRGKVKEKTIHRSARSTTANI